MPVIIPGTDTQQKTVTVANNDTAINAEIAAQGADVTGGWIVSQLTPDGANMVILFQRNVLLTPP